MFDALGVAIKELGQLDPEGLCDEELRDAVVELAKLRDAFTAAEARINRAFDVRRVYTADGARSAAAWLARTTRAPKTECGARLRLGRVCDELPVAAEAWAAGEIGAAHVRRLARARNRRTAELLRRDEPMLVDHARTLTFSDFERDVDYWFQHADPDGADEDEMERRSRRRLSLDETFTGTFSGHMLLDPVSGAIVSAELRRLEQQLFETDWKEAKQQVGRYPLPHELARTPDQRRADALVEMAIRSATAPAGGKRPKPLFTLMLGAEKFSHLCQLGTGQVVAPAAAVPWIDDAQLERILFDGTGERALKVSRKRSFTDAMRRVLEVRDRQCGHEYCDVPAEQCEGDHITPYSAGGLTSQRNGRLLCDPHNRGRQKRPPPGG